MIPEIVTIVLMVISFIFELQMMDKIEYGVALVKGKLHGGNTVTGTHPGSHPIMHHSINIMIIILREIKFAKSRTNSMFNIIHGLFLHDVLFYSSLANLSM